jgi:hypothetical protein
MTKILGSVNNQRIYLFWSEGSERQVALYETPDTSISLPNRLSPIRSALTLYSPHGETAVYDRGNSSCRLCR